MSMITEKVSYIKGLAEGLEISKDKAEGKVIHKILDVLEDIANEMEEMDLSMENLGEFVEELDEDLTSIEEDLYDEDDEMDEDDFLEIECPKCHEIIYFDEDCLASGKLICPVCGADILPEEPDDCQCGCGCEGSKEE